MHVHYLHMHAREKSRNVFAIRCTFRAVYCFSMFHVSLARLHTHKCVGKNPHWTGICATEIRRNFVTCRQRHCTAFTTRAQSHMLNVRLRFVFIPFWRSNGGRQECWTMHYGNVYFSHRNIRQWQMQGFIAMNTWTKMHTVIKNCRGG